MMTRPVMVTFLLSAFVAGCPEQPNEEVRTARDEEVEAAREQREKSAEKTQERAEDRAEDRYEDRKEQADNLPPASQDRADAEARMAQERQIYRSKALERLQKADARIAEARAKAANARSVPLEVRTQIETAAAQREATARELNQIQTVSAQDWNATTQRIDKQLDELESLVARAQERANAL